MSRDAYVLLIVISRSPVRVWPAAPPAGRSRREAGRARARSRPHRSASAINPDRGLCPRSVRGQIIARRCRQDTGRGGHGPPLRARHRPGHDQQPGDPVRPRGPQRRQRPEGAAAAFPEGRLGRARSRRTSGATSSRSAGRRSRPPASPPTEIAAIGITNQRETTVLWERGTGSAVHRAIVWQDRRTAEHCRRLVADGLEEHVRARTGLVVDAYFSGTKLAWLLDNVQGARAAAERGALAFGTIDSFLLWRLTGGRVHATDATNASRTMLFDIGAQAWEPQPAAGAADPRGRAARGARLLGRVRHHRPRPVRRRDPDHGHRRRPAGGDRRPGLLRSPA